MENNFNVSIILPIKTATAREFDDYFNKSITSIKEQLVQVDEIVIVHTDEELLTKKLDDYDFGDLNIKRVVWTESPNFCSQVNEGIKNATSKWISIFEFDDEYSKIWFKNVKKYSEIYKDVQAFLPIVVDVDSKGVFAGFTNEATFAASMSAELGYLSNDTLMQYQNFQTSGMVFLKELYDDFGGLKSNIKLTFVYEFLLRLTFNSVRIMTIPRIGYKHINLREGSIFWNYKEGSSILSEDEVRFWIDSAKKEYYFKEERQISYEPKL